MEHSVVTHNQIYPTPQDALRHYGVKGMRWGVTKDDKAASKSPSARQERKQEKRDVKVAELSSRSAKASVRIREIEAELAGVPSGGIKNAVLRNDLKTQIKQTTNYRDSLDKTAESVQSGKLTPTQKQLLVGGVVAGGAVLFIYGSTKVESGQLNALKLRGEAALRGKPFDFARNESWAGKKTPDEAYALSQGINPAFKSAGGQMNCRRCTFAYELRRRGYNVSATATTVGAGQTETGLINALTPGKRNLTRMTSLSSMTVSGSKGIRTMVVGDTRSNPASKTSISNGLDRISVRNALRAQPDGARGEAVFNFGAFGHSLAYERFGDKTYIFDTQKGKRYDLDSHEEYSDFVSKWSFGGGLKNVEVTRLDNVPLDNKFLARWATNAKSTSTTSAPSTPTPSSSRPRSKPSTSRPANMSKELWRQLQKTSL